MADIGLSAFSPSLRKRFSEHLRTITAYLVFPDSNALMQTLVDSKPPPITEAQIAR